MKAPALSVHPSENVLEVSGLTKRFGAFVAVNDVSLNVRTHTIHALIGPNGAGKTTCFNMLSSFLAPSAGRIVYKGRDITSLPPARVARSGLVRSFQISAVFLKLTVLENVRLALQRREGVALKFWRSVASLHHLDEAGHAILATVGLTAYAGQLAEELSYGRKRALEIATTIALDPEVMLLDEPTSGLGAEDIDRVVELIRSAAKGRTIVMVEHNLAVVEGLCDTVTVLQRGEVLAEGAYRQIASDPRVIEAYLGPDDD